MLGKKNSQAGWRFVCLQFALVVLVSASPAGQVMAADLPQTIERLKQSVVGVGTYMPTRKPEAELRGTGFVVADGRYVITNYHVLPKILDAENYEELAVFTGQSRKVERRKAEKVAVDREHDLALLRIEGARLRAVELADSGAVREGERYAFMGFPIGSVLGMVPVTHEGIIAARTPIAIPRATSKQLDPRVIQRLRAPYEVFQLDATAYPGNSGSPLFDQATGEVIGIINMVFVKESKEAILEKPSGITFAIPSRHARALIQRALGN